MKKVLITGYTGFVGKNFIEYIKTTSNNINIIECDLRNKNWKNIFKNSDVIIHLAGKAHDLRNVLNPDVYFETNTKLAKEVYENFLTSNAKIFIILSSVKAVVDSIDHILTENEVPQPTTIYGKSKLLADDYILNNLPDPILLKKVYILRPCLIHGPQNKGNLIELYNYVSSGHPWPLGKYDNVRSYCSIINLCFVLKELSEREDILSGVYNVADNEMMSTNELVLLISNFKKIKSRILYIPKFFILILAKIGDKFNLPFNSERLQKLTESFQVSNKKLTTALKKDLPLTLKEGLLYTFNSINN